MSHALVRGLRARGVGDVVTALEEGMIEREDEEHHRVCSQNESCFIQLQCGGLLLSPRANTSPQD